MSLGDFIGRGGGGDASLVAGGPSAAMSTAAMAQPPLVNTSNSPALSLALKRPKMEMQGEMALLGENFGPGFMGRERNDEQESRSGSDDLEGALLGDDQEVTGDRNQRRKKYHRHTPYQIQELEYYFKMNNHPDEKQRLELGRRLSLESKQVKFWFQNRRTQMKTQAERHENSFLKRQNEELLSENIRMKEALRNPTCNGCGGPAILSEISLEDHNLRIENARLRDELSRVSIFVNKYLGRPISPLSPILSSSLDLAIGRNGFDHFSPVDSTFSMGLDSKDGILNASPAMHTMPTTERVGTTAGDIPFNKSVFLELAMRAADELIKLAQINDPLWVRSLDGGREALNLEEYMRLGPCIRLQPHGFVTESTRATGTVITSSLALVEILMEANQWEDMFPCLLGRTSVTDVIFSGTAGSRNCALQLMHAEFQAVSPLVPVRSMKFLRFCKQHGEGVWIVVDVAIDSIQEGSDVHPIWSCRRLPSGCIIQDMPNGFSKVTWVEHTEYDENVVHHLYRPLLQSGLVFGAQIWLATLQRQCACLAVLFSLTVSTEDHSGVTPVGRRSMVKLAQRMSRNFCAGVCATVEIWQPVQVRNLGENTRLIMRSSTDGEPIGLVLSASTSVWMPVSWQRLFDFLRDERTRSNWDELLHGGPMQEMVHISKGQDHRNCVSLLRSTAADTNQNVMLILQETQADESGSLIVYTAVDVLTMQAVMNQGDTGHIALLPSGFAIVPDGIHNSGGPEGKSVRGGGSVGSLLTVGFQILINNTPAKLTMESVDTVNSLISRTIQRIKASLRFD
ncbi:hypothetical protein NMG60_11012367 [Bertholletia excelsa]